MLGSYRACSRWLCLAEPGRGRVWEPSQGSHHNQNLLLTAKKVILSLVSRKRAESVRTKLHKRS